MSTMTQRERVKMGYMTTYTGIKFNPSRPTPDMVNIVDVAHSLSNICRFGGHVIQFYPVAQHSVCVAEIVKETNPEKYLKALHHDDPEAYLGCDIPTPVKYMAGMEGYRKMEVDINECVAKKFGFEPGKDPVIKHADNIMVVVEALCLLDPVPGWAREMEHMMNSLPKSERQYNSVRDYSYLFEKIWAPEKAELEFLRAHNMAEIISSRSKE